MKLLMSYYDNRVRSRWFENGLEKGAYDFDIDSVEVD